MAAGLVGLVALPGTVSACRMLLQGSRGPFSLVLISFGAALLIAVAHTCRILHRLRTADRVTGLMNGDHFSDRADALLRKARSADTSFAVLTLNIDDFGGVNQAYGRAFGDRVLRAVGERLQAVVGPGDLLARIGGDEFSILQGGVATLRTVLDRGQLILDQLRRPFDVEGERIELHVSIGVAVAPEDGQTISTLLRRADLALVRAKADGSSVLRLFEAEMETGAHLRRSLAAALRDALPRGEFSVVYQPQIDVGTGRVGSVEALLRWHNPEYGSVSPTDFIPLAEESGLIGSLGDFVLRRACRDALGWPAEVGLAVNLSPAEFRDRRLAERIGSTLEELGFDPTRLELEITEGVLFNDKGPIRTMLEEMRALGLTLALDDFGTGYASLSYLRRYPFRSLKIDRSFVMRLPNDPTSQSIVRAVIAMGRTLGMAVTAEGVETPEQQAALVRDGCNRLQGYLYGRPMSAGSIAKMLAGTEIRSVAA